MQIKTFETENVFLYKRYHSYPTIEPLAVKSSNGSYTKKPLTKKQKLKRSKAKKNKRKFLGLRK
jgi:hypothetical protein